MLKWQGSNSSGLLLCTLVYKSRLWYTHARKMEDRCVIDDLPRAVWDKVPADDTGPFIFASVPLVKYRMYMPAIHDCTCNLGVRNLVEVHERCSRRLEIPCIAPEWRPCGSMCWYLICVTLRNQPNAVSLICQKCIARMLPALIAMEYSPPSSCSEAVKSSHACTFWGALLPLYIVMSTIVYSSVL